MTFPASHPALARALVARDYNTATAVQTAVMQPDALGRDLLVSAQTGSGKTVAFGLAMANALLGEEETFGRSGAPLALIVAPTRELAMQVHRELEWLYAETGARLATCVGGMDVRREKIALENGTHIVVGTPGRLRDHLERRRLDLSKVKAVVLDEADEMLDLGFREDLQFILDKASPERQTLMFSATMPREIAALARDYQRDAVRIETAARHEQHADIEYRGIRVQPNDVENAVVNVLRYYDTKSIVFCTTREATKRLHLRLQERGFTAVALSGELTQSERTTALQSLRDGRARVLVATDVAARGLDLPDLGLVVHADLPHEHETLLHRSGRTGRAGKKGICAVIVPATRRRKADMLFGAARLRVTWAPAPTADEIRAKDHERFLQDPIFSEPASEEDLVQARALLEGREPEEVALALLRFHRSRLPSPEDFSDDVRPQRSEPRVPRERGEGRSFDRGEERPRREGPRGQRNDRREMVWFRLNIGRERNAEPRWLLPLICKAGGITKAELGSIKIFDRDTRFEVAAEFADQFALAVRTNKSKEGHISRVGTAESEATDREVVAAIDALVGNKPAEVATETAGDVAATAEASTAPVERPAYVKRDRTEGDAGRKEWRDRKPKFKPAPAAETETASSPPRERERDFKPRHRDAEPARDKGTDVAARKPWQDRKPKFDPLAASPADASPPREAANDATAKSSFNPRDPNSRKPWHERKPKYEAGNSNDAPRDRADAPAGKPADAAVPARAPWRDRKPGGGKPFAGKPAFAGKKKPFAGAGQNKQAYKHKKKHRGATAP